MKKNRIILCIFCLFLYKPKTSFKKSANIRSERRDIASDTKDTKDNIETLCYASICNNLDNMDKS